MNQKGCLFFTIFVSSLTQAVSLLINIIKPYFKSPADADRGACVVLAVASDAIVSGGVRIPLLCGKAEQLGVGKGEVWHKPETTATSTTTKLIGGARGELLGREFDLLLTVQVGVRLQ